MKNYLHLILMATFSMLIFNSCFKDVFCEKGQGDTETLSMLLDDFNSISLEEAAEVIVRQGDEQEVVVTGRENILERLQTDVVGGIWEINLGRDCYIDLDLKIEITIPNLEEINLSGSGIIQVDDFENQENLDISLSGSGSIELNRFTGTQDVDIKISSSGKIIANGNFPDLEKLNLELTGSGRFDGYDMTMNEFDVKIAGSGNLYVTVEEYMNVRITGSGNLHYKGNPLIDANITGTGKIIDEN